MAQRCITRAEFCQVIQGIAEQFAEALWATVVETGSAGADAWVRTHGSAWLRRALGVALSARAERLGVSGTCACGSAVTFRQHRPTRVHTVLPGRDVEATVLYGQCRAYQRGSWPVLTELGVDVEGFTPALQALATLASVVEPYEAASTELLGRMAGVHVSTEKMQALVREEGARATATLTTAPPEPGPAGPPGVVWQLDNAPAPGVRSGRARRTDPSPGVGTGLCYALAASGGIAHKSRTPGLFGGH